MEKKKCMEICCPYVGVGGLSVITIKEYLDYLIRREEMNLSHTKDEKLKEYLTGKLNAYRSLISWMIEKEHRKERFGKY
jgi:hypothetical protein